MSIGGWTHLLNTKALAAAPDLAIVALALAFAPALLRPRFRRRHRFSIFIWVFMTLLATAVAGGVTLGLLEPIHSRPPITFG